MTPPSPSPARTEREPREQTRATTPDPDGRPASPLDDRQALSETSNNQQEEQRQTNCVTALYSNVIVPESMLHITSSLTFSSNHNLNSPLPGPTEPLKLSPETGNHGEQGMRSPAFNTQGQGEMMTGETIKGDQALNLSQSDPNPHQTSADSSPGSSALLRPEPKIHIRSVQKIKNWHLEVIKSFLIIGDSNLARFTPFTNPEVQVDSYPGAQFHHIQGVLEKLTPNTTVRKVILSLGLNNCLRKQLPLTIIKQLNRCLKQTKDIFPQAEVYIPLINFSPSLEEGCTSRITALNEYVMQKHLYITDINTLLFKVRPDHIHWTTKTADRILQHWLSQLNL
ncbi:unnamed protein product [Ophioblennius macclurei]